MQFNVTLTLSVNAPDRATAEAIGIGACEHLVDTFNDDESIGALAAVNARPVRYHVVQYRHGAFDAIMSGMGRHRGTCDSDHSRRAAQRHARALRAEPWRERAGLTYRVEGVLS